MLRNFDLFCDRWEREHPGEEADVPALFAQWMADGTGSAVIGIEETGSDIVVAIPDAAGLDAVDARC